MPGTALCLSVAAASLGCYSYVPATLNTVPLAAGVRALLSTEAQLRLKDSLGLDLRELRGTVVERAEGHVMVQVRTGTGSAELGSQALYERITVSPSDVLRVDRRRISMVRTGLIVAAVAGVATVAVLEAFGGGKPGTPAQPPGGGSERLAGW